MWKKIIDVKNLYKVYKMGDEKIYALKNINLSINKNEILTLLGTSGSGKSTLLNTLAGLEKPTKGKVHIGRITISKLNEKQVTKFRQINIGFICQSYNLISSLTALENVEMSLMLKEIYKKLDKTKLRKYYTMLDLGKG